MMFTPSLTRASVPHREALPASGGARCELGNQEVLSPDLLLERPVRGGVGLIERGPEHRDGPAPGIHRRLVGGGVDTLGQAAHGDHPPAVRPSPGRRRRSPSPQCSARGTYG